MRRSSCGRRFAPSPNVSLSRSFGSAGENGRRIHEPIAPAKENLWLACALTADALSADNTGLWSPLVSPVEGTLFDRVNVPHHQDADETKHAPEDGRAVRDGLSIHDGPRIHE